MSRILVIDDEPAICWALEQALRDDGHQVTTASTTQSGLGALETFAPELIFLDYRLPGAEGLQGLRRYRQQAGEVPVILMTAFGSLRLAVDALELGAFDYLPKPFDIDTAVEVVSRALGQRQPSAPISTEPADEDEELLGVSRPMQDVFRQIAMVAQHDVPVLITGESGVGKELVARAIHRFSGRRDGSFVPVCLPTLSESILESELFGHVKGAFTGAEAHRAGLLDQAHQGTAFFDEIGDIPLIQQVKLLRVLEDRQIIPVGSTQAHPSSFRLIAATHQPLDRMVAEGRFRQDLFYRLSVFQIPIPPLRARPEDIPVLAERFLSQIAAGREKVLSGPVLDELCRRRWPGNVRELRSAIHHAAVCCRGTSLMPDDLPPERAEFRTDCDRPARQLPEQFVLDWTNRQLASGAEIPGEGLYESFLSQFESPLLNAALQAAQGNRSAAADLLGVHRETLRKRLRKYETDSDGGSESSGAADSPSE